MPVLCQLLFFYPRRTQNLKLTKSKAMSMIMLKSEKFNIFKGENLNKLTLCKVYFFTKMEEKSLAITSLKLKTVLLAIAILGLKLTDSLVFSILSKC